MSLLEVHEVSKTYAGNERAAVRHVTFSVTQGEFVSLVGESGSGKTTLLRLIAGLEKTDEGTIRLGGRELSHTGWHVPPEKRGVGLVFQHHALFPHLTVEANVAFGIRQIQSSERNAKVSEMLDLVGLPAYGKRYPHELSGGEKQRVALARALATEPGVLLLDEPFSSLDPQLRQSLRDETHRVLRTHGTTAILVTHHTLDALAISDRIAVMHHGVLEQYDKPEVVYHQPANAYVAELFGPCNSLPVDLNGTQDAVWIRPDELVLVSAKQTDVKLSGIITQITYGGGYHDVTLSCEGKGADAAFNVKVCHQDQRAIKEGERWGIARKS